MELIFVLGIIASGSVFVPLFTIAVRNFVLSRELYWVRWMLIVGISAEWGSVALGRLDIPNLFVIHLYVLLEAYFVIRIFQEFWEFSESVPLYIFVGLCIFELIQLLIGQGINENPSNTRALIAVLYTAIAIGFFITILERLSVPKLIDNFHFWMSAGLLVFSCGNLFLFVLSNAILKESSNELAQSLYGFFFILTVVKNLFVSIGIWRSQSNLSLSTDH